jgi:hypothetical protein
MRAANSRVLVLPDEKPIETTAGMKTVKSGLLYVPVYNEHEAEFSYQTGVVQSVPDDAYERVDNDEQNNPVYKHHKIMLAAGDRVLCHHMLRGEHLEVLQGGVAYSALHYHHVFAKIDGEGLVPNCDWNFIEPLEVVKPETHDVIISLQQKGTSKTYGYVRFLSDSLKKTGVNVGDLVGIEPQCAYEIVWNNKIYYRVETENVAIVVQGAEYIS